MLVHEVTTVPGADMILLQLPSPIALYIKPQRKYYEEQLRVYGE